MKMKRGYTRFTIETKVELKTEGEPPDVFKGELIDISFAGFCAYLKEKIGVDTMVKFQITPSTYVGYPFGGRAKVKYVLETKKHGAAVLRTGFEFIGLEEGVIIGFINKIQQNNLSWGSRRGY